MRQSLLQKNKKLIIDSLKQKHILKRNELSQLVVMLKEKSLIPQSIYFAAMYEFFIEVGLTVHILELNGVVIERYTMYKEPDIYKLAASIKAKSFFSMTTALSMQGLLNENGRYIFVSSELSQKTLQLESLTQELIDEAYKKPYRLTKNYGKFKENYIVLLSPKNTNQFEVIDYNGYRLSSINRAFVEMVVNLQYFQGSLNIIQLFKPLKAKLDISRIVAVIDKFNFVYPYYQLFGFLLEQISFDKVELQSFKLRVSHLKFYTDKQQGKYKFNKYWNIYYI